MPKSDRVWNLRLNLDEFNSLIASVFTDGDRALLLQGLSLGCNGGPLPDGVPPAFMRGWMFGNSSRDEAEEFKARQSAKGKISAEARKEKSGTAQPVKPVSNSGSELVQATVRTAPEAILNPQSYNNNPQTTNDNPPPIAPPGGRRTGGKKDPVEPGVFDDLFVSILPESLRSAENLSQWHDWISYRNEHKQGKGRGTIVPLTMAAAKQSLFILKKAKRAKTIASLISTAISSEWDGIHIPYGGEEEFYK